MGVGYVLGSNLAVGRALREMRLRAPGMIMPQCDLILFEVAFLFKLAFMVISVVQFSCPLGMRGCVNVRYLE